MGHKLGRNILAVAVFLMGAFLCTFFMQTSCEERVSRNQASWEKGQQGFTQESPSPKISKGD